MSESAVEGLRGVSPAYAKFRDAVLDLSDDPTKANIERYLSASRALDGEQAQDRALGRRNRNGQGSSK
jgi:hypothetical protein